MSNRSRVTRILILILTAITGVFTAPSGHAFTTMREATWRDGDSISVGLPWTPTSGPPISDAIASPLDESSIAAMSPVASRIALISSGIDKNVFPTSLAARITTLGSSGDPIGYGTYAASVILQLNQASTIVSLGSYPGGVFSADTFNLNLAYVINNAAAFDAVLIDIPPTDLLDPVSAAMQAGIWDDVLDSIADAPLKSSGGTMYGIAMDDSLFSTQTISYHNASVLKPFRDLLKMWTTASSYIKTINSLGISVVMPAGDLGPRPQTIFGLSNLSEVITVGGFNTSNTAQGRPTATVSEGSGAGPSIDLKVKPDLLASTNIMGLLPPNSTLAIYLSNNGGLDPNLQPHWTTSTSDPYLVAPAKARLDTTLTSAAVVAAATGGIATGIFGVRDSARQRGALYRKAEPIPGLAVWRQGQGVLGSPSLNLSVPTSAFAASAPMVLGHLNFGLEPSSGTWTASATVAQGSPVTAAVTYQDFIGVDILGRSTTTTATASTSPPISVSTATSVLNAVATVGNDYLPSGVYCSYVITGIAASSSSVTETVPSCATNGFKPVAHSFQIHDRSAVTETFELATALPPGADILDMPLHFLPVNPVGSTLFTKTSSDDICSLYGLNDPPPTSALSLKPCLGHARFNVIPPGYYRVRAWSDYGAPITTVTTPTATPGVTITNDADIGQPLGYSTYKTLLLPRPAECVETYDEYDNWSDQVTPTVGWPDAWKQCSEKALNKQGSYYSPPAVTTYEPSTSGWLITTSTADVSRNPIRVNLGYLRKSMDTAVSSRYIDIVHPCDELQFASLRTPPQSMKVTEIVNAQPGEYGWSKGCDNLESLVAQLDSGTGSGSTGQVGAGVAKYPFNLTNPNYSAHMNLNFAYEVNNAFILVLVVIGGEVNLGMVTPDGVVNLAPQGPNGTINTTVTAHGFGDGQVNMDWKFLPRGASTGQIIFVFVPVQSYTTTSLQSLGSWAKIEDSPTLKHTLSFELDTQMTVAWPGINFSHRFPVGRSVKPCSADTLPDSDCGHSFRVQSNYNPRTVDSNGKYSGQMSGECRDQTGATQSAHICEEWTVLTQLPKHEETATHTAASLMDVVDPNALTYLSIIDDLNAKGGGIYEPAVPRLYSATTTLGFSGGLNDATSISTSTATATATAQGGLLQTSGAYFKQLYFPHDFLKAHPGVFEVCINDGPPRTTSNCPGTLTHELTGDTWTSTTVSVTSPVLPTSPSPAPRLGAYVGYLTRSSFL